MILSTVPTVRPPTVVLKKSRLPRVAQLSKRNENHYFFDHLLPRVQQAQLKLLFPVLKLYKDELKCSGAIHTVEKKPGPQHQDTNFIMTNYLV